MNYIVVGLSGHIGSGKNYIAEEIFLPSLIKTFPEKKFIPYFFSFGDHVKVECLCRNINFKFHDFFIEKTDETRTKLQQYATENGRDAYHNDIWIRAVDTWINIQLERLKNLSNIYTPIFIISDVRFINELDYILSKNGLIIRIEAHKRSHQRIYNEAKGNEELINKIKNHLSEISLDQYNFKYIVNNDIGIENVNQQVTDIIAHFFG